MLASVIRSAILSKCQMVEPKMLAVIIELFTVIPTALNYKNWMLTNGNSNIRSHIFQESCRTLKRCVTSSRTILLHILEQEWVCTIATPNGRITLSDNSLTITKNETNQKRIQSEKEFLQLLTKHFGMNCHESSRIP